VCYEPAGDACTVSAARIIGFASTLCVNDCSELDATVASGAGGIAEDRTSVMRISHRRHYRIRIGYAGTGLLDVARIEVGIDVPF
jgi:hypothetical protein